MEWSHWGLTLCILFSALGTVSLSDGEGRKLSRRRRYVVFPEGSSFSIALCMTMHTLTPDNIFTEGLNWGISYDLPNESKPALEPFLQLRKDRPIPSKHHYKLNKDHIRNENSLKYNNWYKHPGNRYYNLDDGKKYYYRKSDYDYIKRRHRRELYNKLEVIMNAMGFEGRTCIQRALCEASQRLMPKGNTLVEEMMRIAFSLPLKRVLLSHEPVEHHTYTEAHRAGRKGTRCDTMFSGCPFSLIDMALGKYSSETGSQPDLPEPVQDIPGNSVMKYFMK
ncbi:uncharacterized protein LOC107036710 [Diachasma alloeum]|uniref:uncharacterized protein LOC107036710 n=1 Tax=Diachasma alloeum TaxID=454923 RepID=UPI0007382BB5|nr:uncharacterized protein LOC107036710 [Diachasma alloeum]